jgi:hypothetical protein
MDTTSTIQNQFRYFKNKTPSFVPKEDGFITTSGNPSLGIKYGNNYQNLNLSVENNNIKFNNGLGTKWQS